MASKLELFGTVLSVPLFAVLLKPMRQLMCLLGRKGSRAEGHGSHQLRCMGKLGLGPRRSDPIHLMITGLLTPTEY